jgi:thiol-disulfide isomerase/thioredoxin
MRRTLAVRLTRRGFLVSVAATPPVLLTACGVVPSQGSALVGDFTISAYQGADVFGGPTTQFSQLFTHGKPVILNFWAGLCPPCRAEMPGFQRVVDQYADRVLLVGVDIGPFVGLGSHDDARALLRELGIRYPTAYAVGATPLRQYQVRSMLLRYHRQPARVGPGDVVR